MGISSKTLKILWGKSGGKCAFPGCNQELISIDDKTLGEMCHIVARKEDGPRGKENRIVSNMDDVDNLILLCSNHHKEIDSMPEKYTVDVLKQFKKEHEENIRARLHMGHPWEVNFSQIYYMNLRRIEMLAAQQGIEIAEEMQTGQCLHSLGWNLHALMSNIRCLIEALEIRAEEMSEHWEALRVGQFVSIKGMFYTKNIPAASEVCANRYHATGELEKDAHLYHKYGSKKCILTIDPNWLATTTAFVNFKMGRVEVAGIGLITAVDDEWGRMLITPYILGVPKSEMDILFSEQVPRSITIGENFGG